MEHEPDRHRLVFVGGLHRSGTTLLANLIAEHPLATGFAGTGVPADEGQHLQTVYPTAKAHGGAGRFAFARNAHLTERSPLVSVENEQRLFSEWARYWDLERPVLVEKSPPNLIRGRFLQALFPGALFVMIMRHPVAVSLATRKWSKTSVPSLLRHWVVAHRTFARDRPMLERVHVVTYEALVADPGRCLERVFAFLGLDPVAVKGEIRPGSNATYFDRWRSHRAAAAALSLAFGWQVARFGYSLRDLDRTPADGC